MSGFIIWLSVLDMVKHIVLVDTWRVVNAKGGTERVLCDMANALCLIGYRVTVICLDREQGQPGFSMSDDVRFVNAYRGGASILSRGLFKNIRALSFLRDVRREKRFWIESEWKIRSLSKVFNELGSVDLVISFQPTTSYFLSKISNLSAPIITMLHSAPHMFNWAASVRSIRSAVSSSALITVLMPGFRDLVKKMFPGAIVKVMPNAIPQYANSACLDKKKIICIARLARDKRVELLVHSFSLLLKKSPDWTVDFFGDKDGDPVYRDEIFNLCKKLKLKDKFIFKGVTSEVENALESASIFAFPSQIEGFPMALGEAMAKGLPVVGCLDCMGVNDLIKNEQNGLLVDSTPEVFANALSRLIDDLDLRLRLGAQARKDISKYCPEQVWSMWHHLIEELINDHK